MFLNQTHLPQLLEADCYYRPIHFDQEVAEMFLPGWHCVGTLAEIPREGDYLTQTLLDRPLIVWRKQGEPHAFINVCAHRFSKLTDKPCGHAERLTCQYHGWEYDESGRTQRIPDAQSFRPLANQQLGLRKLAVETCGQLIFANFSEDQKLEDQFSTAGLEILESLFCRNFRLTYRMEEEIEANWKVASENALESYHVGCVHAKSFASMPTAETCTHELHEAYTLFETNAPSQAPALLRAIERLFHRILGIPHVERYQHYHFYPNLMVSHSKFFSAVMVVEPCGPTRSRFVLRIFGNPGQRTNMVARAVFRLSSYWARRAVCKVLREDFAVLPSIQQGLQSPELPNGGLVSIREERIHHFQKTIRARTVGAGHEIAQPNPASSS